MFRKLATLPILALVACSGEPSQQAVPDGLKKAVQAETPEQFTELADAIAQDFINYVNDDLEFMSITFPWDSHKPERQCFDLWHKKDKLVPTPDVLNECQLWVQELAEIYGTYGYAVKPIAFKSELFWSHLQTVSDSGKWGAASKLYQAKQGPDPRCPKRAQKGYTEPETIPWGAERPDRCAPGEEW